MLGFIFAIAIIVVVVLHPILYSSCRKYYLLQSKVRGQTSCSSFSSVSNNNPSDNLWQQIFQADNNKMTTEKNSGREEHEEINVIFTLSQFCLCCSSYIHIFTLLSMPIHKCLYEQKKKDSHHLFCYVFDAFAICLVNLILINWILIKFYICYFADFLAW